MKRFQDWAAWTCHSHTMMEKPKKFIVPQTSSNDASALKLYFTPRFSTDDGFVGGTPIAV